MDTNALFKISYGLYALTTAENGVDNACIIDAFSQVTGTEPIFCVANINKKNHTHNILMNTKKFNLSVLTKNTPYAFFQRFGMQSGRDVNKFEGYEGIKKGANGLLYFTDYTNAVLSFETTNTLDFGSHTLFSAQLTDAAVLSNQASLTYSHYRAHIKPKAETTKRGWTCAVCDYVHESDTPPDNFPCPLCQAVAWV